MWTALKATGIVLDPPTKIENGLYLGCSQCPVELSPTFIESQHRLWTAIGTAASQPIVQDEDVLLKEATSDLEATLEQATTEAKTSKKKKPKATAKAKAKATAKAQAIARPNQDVKAWQYMMGHGVQCVERYLELSGLPLSSLKEVTTPCIDDHLIAPEDNITKGRLASVCSKCVLKVLYFARYLRPDCLYATNILARLVTKWTVACDKRLHRLICYIHQTVDYTMTCHVGDDFHECEIAMFADAGFAGDLQDSKSTSGGLIAILGKHTFVPLIWMCKKQTAVSHSSLSLIHI